MRFKRGLALTAAATAVMMSIAIPANADTASEEEKESVTVPLRFAGFDPERAAQYGWDIRTDAAGLQYAVPAGTPEGSMEGATRKYNPATGKFVSTGEIGALDTVNGDCGTATLTLTGKSRGYTAYNIYRSATGAAVSHTWNVAFHSSIDAGSVPLSGLPPFPGVSFQWETNFNHPFQALSGTLLTGMAGGTVYTVLGSCYSGAPTSTVRW